MTLTPPPNFTEGDDLAYPDPAAPDPVYEDIPDGLTLYPGATPNLPEAGGNAWCKMYTFEGVEVSLTERRATGKDALSALIGLMEYAKMRYGLLTVPPPLAIPASPVVQKPMQGPPASNPDDAAAMTGMAVRYVKKVMTRPKPGKASRPGLWVTTIDNVDRWAELKICPLDTSGWELNKRYDAPPEMRHVSLGGNDGTKVIGFHE